VCDSPVNHFFHCSLGYDGFFIRRIGERHPEGEATFFKSDRFVLLERAGISFADLIEEVGTPLNPSRNLFYWFSWDCIFVPPIIAADDGVLGPAVHVSSRLFILVYCASGFQSILFRCQFLLLEVHYGVHFRKTAVTAALLVRPIFYDPWPLLASLRVAVHYFHSQLYWLLQRYPLRVSKMFH